MTSLPLLLMRLKTWKLKIVSNIAAAAFWACKNVIYLVCNSNKNEDIFLLKSQNYRFPCKLLLYLKWFNCALWLCATRTIFTCLLMDIRYGLEDDSFINFRTWFFYIICQIISIFQNCSALKTLKIKIIKNVAKNNMGHPF